MIRWQFLGIGLDLTLYLKKKKVSRFAIIILTYRHRDALREISHLKMFECYQSAKHKCIIKTSSLVFKDPVFVLFVNLISLYGHVFSTDE